VGLSSNTRSCRAPEIRCISTSTEPMTRARRDASKQIRSGCSAASTSTHTLDSTRFDTSIRRALMTGSRVLPSESLLGISAFAWASLGAGGAT
jgi:hypothetical protein